VFIIVDIYLSRKSLLGLSSLAKVKSISMPQVDYRQHIATILYYLEVTS